MDFPLRCFTRHDSSIYDGLYIDSYKGDMSEHRSTVKISSVVAQIWVVEDCNI